MRPIWTTALRRSSAGSSKRLASATRSAGLAAMSKRCSSRVRRETSMGRANSTGVAPSMSCLHPAERQFAAQQRGGRRRVERRGLAAQIGGDALHLCRRRLGGAEQIAPQRLVKRLVALQTALIGADAAVKGFRHFLHLTADAEIARSHLAPIAVEIGEHDVEQPLREK